MRQMILRAAALCALAAATTAAASAQTPDASATPEPAARASAPRGGMTGGLFALEEVERQLREQREEIEQLRAAVREQSRLIGELRSRVEGVERLAGAAAAAGAARDGGAAVLHDASYAAHAGGDANPTANANAQGPPADAALEARVARAEEQSKKASEAVAKQIGNMTFSGDLRLRYESFYGQQNALANPDDAGALGNPLTPRHRLRVRARLGIRGKIGDEFDWGLRLSTGGLADVTS